MDFKRAAPKETGGGAECAAEWASAPCLYSDAREFKLGNWIAVVSWYWQLIEVLDDRTTRVADHVSVSVAVGNSRKVADILSGQTVEQWGKCLLGFIAYHEVKATEALEYLPVQNRGMRSAQKHRKFGDKPLDVICYLHHAVEVTSERREPYNVGMLLQNSQSELLIERGFKLQMAIQQIELGIVYFWLVSVRARTAANERNPRCGCKSYFGAVYGPS